MLFVRSAERGGLFCLSLLTVRARIAADHRESVSAGRIV
jgi:hypothetical protein